MHVSSSCLEHLACDECWNVHLRRREERRRGEEERRRWREGRDKGEGRERREGEEEERRRWREGRDRGEGGGEGNNDVDSELIHPLLACHLSCSLEESCSRVSNGNTNFILK